MRRPMFEGLEDRISLTTDVWTGAAARASQDYSWSNAGNWSNGKPQGGQDLIFPTGGTTFIPPHAIMNDLSGMTFDSIEIDGKGYSIAGDAITLTAATGLVTTYPAGVSSFSINTNLVGGGVVIASGGELDIDGVVSGSNGFTLSGGGILGGNGQVSKLTVESGVVQPGVAGVGSLQVQGGANLDAGTAFTASINNPGTNSSLMVSGGAGPAVTLVSPTLNPPTLTPGYIPAPGTAFPIIQGSVSGTFNNQPEGSYISSGGTTFRVTYDQGVVLTAVAPTTIATSIVSGTSPSVFGQSLTFQATISDAGGTPTGTVTFEDGTTVLGTAPVRASGIATFTTSQLGIGQHSITSVYGGDAKFAGSTSAAFNQTVNLASTTTTVTPSANPAAFGQNVIFTAKVAPAAPGGGGPTGQVTFLDGTTQLAVVTLSAGSAMFSTSSMTLGSHSISVQYSGDGNFNGSASAPVNEVVNQSATKTTITPSSNPSIFGQSVTYTVQVAAAAPGSGTPTGSVNLYDGTTELGSMTLNAGSMPRSRRLT